jgi:hypothetical protein
MAWTSADLAALEAAILSLTGGSGVAQVTFANGHQIRYKESDLDKLLTLRSSMQMELGTVHRRVYAKNMGRVA